MWKAVLQLLESGVLDTVLKQPSRPWATMVARKPQLPIRENYAYRFLANLLWFGRNYLNVIVFAVVVASYWYPMFIICTGAALKMHVCEDPRHKKIWQCIQLVSCAFSYWFHGILPALLVTVVLSAIICLHAVLMPYTDEMSRNYDNLLSKTKVRIAIDEKGDLGRPRTPVRDYTEGDLDKKKRKEKSESAMKDFSELDKEWLSAYSPAQPMFPLSHSAFDFKKPARKRGETTGHSPYPDSDLLSAKAIVDKSLEKAKEAVFT